MRVSNLLIASLVIALLFIYMTNAAVAAPRADGAWLNQLSDQISSELSPDSQASDDLVQETAGFYQRIAKQPRTFASSRPTAKSPPDREAISRGELQSNSRIVNAALRYLGAPYVWGGESARGFDCSGLVKRVMAELSHRVPHSAAALARLGLAVEPEELQSGDLLFFRTSEAARISHVGIYLQGGKFVHAARGPGKVTISSLAEPRYRRIFAWARRLTQGQMQLARLSITKQEFADQAGKT